MKKTSDFGTARELGYAAGYSESKDENPYTLNLPKLAAAYDKAYTQGRSDADEDRRDAEEKEIRDSRQLRDDMSDQALLNRALDVMADCNEYETAIAGGRPDPFTTRSFNPRDARTLAAGDLEEVAARLKAPTHRGQEICPSHTKYEEIDS